MRPRREHVLKVKLSDFERNAWEEAANGEALAAWVRRRVNELLDLRHVASGEEVWEPAQAESSSPEERLHEATIAAGERLRDLAPPLQPDHLIDFDPNCRYAAHHWQIKRGEACISCGGVGR